MLPPILQNHHVLAVHDVKRSAAFYVEMLGFTIVAEPPGWIFVEREKCLLMLGECPQDMAPGELGCHSYFAYFCVADADAWHAELTTKGADISPIEDKPWGMREFALRTVDGHRLMIAQTLTH